MSLSDLDNAFVDSTLDDWSRRVLDNVYRAFLSDGRSDSFGRVNGFSGGSAVSDVGGDVAWDRGCRQDRTGYH